jgi:hypothetical protein
MPDHPTAPKNTIAAIIAAAPYADQIARPRFPSAPTLSTSAASVRSEITVITERAARVALARVGAGGGLRAHRIDEGWVFAPYPGQSGNTGASTTWLVAHDGSVHDLSGNETPTRGPVYGKPVTTR